MAAVEVDTLHFYNGIVDGEEEAASSYTFCKGGGRGGWHYVRHKCTSSGQSLPPSQTAALSLPKHRAVSQAK